MNRRLCRHGRPAYLRHLIRAVGFTLCFALAYAGAPRCEFTKSFFKLFVVEVSQDGWCHQGGDVKQSRESRGPVVAKVLDPNECKCAFNEYLSVSLPQPERQWGIETSPHLTLLFVSRSAYNANPIRSPFLELDLPPPKV